MRGILVDLDNKKEEVIIFNNHPRNNNDFEYENAYEERKTIKDVIYISHITEDEVKFMAGIDNSTSYKIILM